MCVGGEGGVSMSVCVYVALCCILLSLHQLALN